MNTIWYMPLEAVKSRYTHQLSTIWAPKAFELALYDKKDSWQFVPVTGEEVEPVIKVGQILDATGRGIYSLSQMSNLLKAIRDGRFVDGDVIYLQDFWTPGLEAIYYALDLYGYKKVRVYATNWAQSMDEFDFTHNMLPWIRHYELGNDSRLAGMFVGSTIHRDQIKKAGFKAPVHVVALPFSSTEIYDRLSVTADTLAKDSDFSQRQNRVIFSSRVDREKNPIFMVQVAERWLNNNPSWSWTVTTSAPSFRSNMPGALEAMQSLADRNPRFQLFSNLTKDEYYHLLRTSKLQFNSSLQDYVAFTMLEATALGCEIAYPNFRSFPECVPADRLYDAFSVEDAVQVMTNALYSRRFHQRAYMTANNCMMNIARIILYNHTVEYNIWENTNNG